MLLLVDDTLRRREPRRRPERIRMPWRVVPSCSAAVACMTVSATSDGAVGLIAVIGAFAAACRALDRALPYGQGLREHRQ